MVLVVAIFAVVLITVGYEERIQGRLKING